MSQSINVKDLIYKLEESIVEIDIQKDYAKLMMNDLHADHFNLDLTDEVNKCIVQYNYINSGIKNNISYDAVLMIEEKLKIIYEIHQKLFECFVVDEKIESEK